MAKKSEDASPDRTGSIRSRRCLASLLLGVCLPAVLTTVALRLAPMPRLDACLSSRAGMRLLDREGRLLAVVQGADGTLRESCAWEEIPESAREQVVALEDGRFHAHAGVDPFALGRAWAFLIQSGRASSGASTLSMQVSRVLRPHGPGPAGKASEMAYAALLETRLDKRRILELYCNLVPWGRNAVGMGAAARLFFDKALSALDPAQTLLLAVLPRAPAIYDPFDHPDRLAAAALSASRSHGLGIGEEEIREALASVRRGARPDEAPHFTRRIMEAPPVPVRPFAPVTTSLDLSLNRFLEERIRTGLERYRGSRITNAAALAIDNRTGETLAWVGSGDFGDARRSGQIDGVLIRRQSASTLKPFLYALALERGLDPSSLLPDLPMSFGAEEAWTPVNFDRRSHGVVRLRTALASSLNVPAVFTLSRVGTGSFVRTLADLGFALPPDAASRYGLGAAIGNVEVSLLELVRAFCVFPRGGIPLSGVRLFDPRTAWLICDILSDPAARSLGFGTRTYFSDAFPAMFKSGTSSEFTNLWCVGATPRYTVGVWAGNFDGRAVIGKTGSILPAQIVSAVLERLTTEPEPFRRPAGIAERRICTQSGAAASGACPSTRLEYFPAGHEPSGTCPLHGGGVGTDLYAGVLLGAVVGGQAAPRILFPVDNQVFYRDPTVEPASQRISFLIQARPADRLTIAVDGIPEDLSFPFPFSMPAAPGMHEAVVSGPGGRSTVTFLVR